MKRNAKFMKMFSSSCFTGLSSYLPGMEISEDLAMKMAEFLTNETRIRPEIIEHIEETHSLCGFCDTPETLKKKDMYEDFMENFSDSDVKDPYLGRTHFHKFRSEEEDSIEIEPFESEVLSAALVFLGNEIVKKDDIDCLLHFSRNNKYYSPTNATKVAYLLKLKNDCGVFHIDTACSSTTSSYQIGTSFVKTGMYKNILGCFSCFNSSFLQHKWVEDPFLVRFGDAANSYLISEVDDEYGIINHKAYCDGFYHGCISLQQDPFDMKVNDLEIARGMFDATFQPIQNLLNSVLEGTDIDLDDVKCIIPHQAFQFFRWEFADRLGLPYEKVHTTFSQTGNISSNSVLVNLFDAIACGKLKEGDVIVMINHGSGFVLFANLIKISPNLVQSIQSFLNMQEKEFPYESLVDKSDSEINFARW